MVPAPPQLNADAWVLMDARTGEMLAAHNEDERLPPASLTKMMTDYIIAAEIAAGRASLDEEVTISEQAWRTGGSKMFVRVGDKVRLGDLVKGIVIQSGNDASVAAAEHIAGSVDAFADLMNQHARRLGLENTHFTNATGLPDPDQYSSAQDLARLARALVRDHPEHYELYAQKYFTYGTDVRTGEPIRQRNRNDLLWRDRSVDGVKTGHTEAAGYCLVASAERDGMRLISVVMGAGSERARAQESQKLLSYGFRFYETQELYAAGESLETRRVWKGIGDQVSLGVREAVVLTLPRGSYEGLEAQVSVTPYLTAPIERYERLGRVRLSMEGETLWSGPLVALEPVEPAGFFRRLWDAVQLFFVRLFA